VIDQAARSPVALEERREQQRPPNLDQIKCGRCGNPLLRALLTVGSYAEERCHHSIMVDANGAMLPKGVRGKRETCGYVTRVWPTR
jgi:hypothetical protein